MAVRGDHHGRMKRSDKKGAPKGSGGNKRGLRAKGPTPKAENRPYHAAYRARIQKERREETQAAQRKARAKRSLIHVRRGHQLVAGRNPVLEALESDIPVTRVFVAGNLAANKKLSVLLAKASAQGAPIVEVPRSDLDLATEGAVHQGVAIEVPEFAYSDLEDLFENAENNATPPLIVLLDGVTDPHNLGAIVRSAAAFGASGVVIPGRRSASMNVTAWKASAGAAARLPIARVSNLVNAIKQCKEQGCFVLGLDGGGTSSVSESGLADGPLALVTGAEGDGISRLAKENCDLLTRIEISSAVESLNAAVATGIALFEVAAVRREKADALPQEL